MKRATRTGTQIVAAVALMLLAMTGAQAQDLQATVQSGWKALQENKLADARAAFQSVLDAAPNYDFGWYALGQVAIRENKLDEAIDHFKKASELKPEKFEYYYGLAAAYGRQQEYAKAVATLNNGEQYAADKQNQFYLHQERGVSYLSLKQYDRAAEDLGEAAELQPGEFTTEQRLGMSLFGIQDFAEAVQHLRKAVAKKPGDYTSQFYLARSLLNAALLESDDATKDSYYVEAAQAAQAAVRVKSGFDAQNVLARAYLGAKQFDKAAPAFQAVLKSKPDYCPARINLGQAYVQQENWEGATEILEQARQCDSSSTSVLDLMGLAYSKRGMRDESLAAYEQLYSMKPTEQTASNIDRVKKNMEIESDNQAIDDYNSDQLEEIARAKEEFERQKLEFEEQQKKLDKYKEVTEDE